MERVSGGARTREASPFEDSPSFGYRPELDGLRTIAVYLVVAYHAGLSWFSNGYLGVDVFFVLSGFLVTNVLLNELAEYGQIRFTRFYARRIRRLLPAASVTIVGTLIGLRLVASAAERAPVEADARAASLWFANFNAIDRVQNEIANPSPLLHFWSLSIEEQFYVFFPIALLGLWVACSRQLVSLWWALAGLTIVFAGFQVLANRSDWVAGYYSTPARIYQMLVGAALAALLRSGSRWIPRLSAWVTVVSLSLVVILSLGILPAIDVSMRGAAVAGLTGLTLAGLMQNDGLATRGLSNPILVYLGGLSYAIYLFHVPIGVLTEYAVGPLNPWFKLLYTAAVSTVLAAASSRLLEGPIRRRGALDNNHLVVIGLGLGSAVFLGLVIVPSLI